jgi:hypothetical protein
MRSTKAWCRAVCSRDSGRSSRVCSAASNSLACAPTPGSKAFRRYREQSPWRIDIKPDHIGGFHPSCPAMGRASNVFIRCQNVGGWGTGLRVAGPDPAMTSSIATLIMRSFNSKEFLPGNPSNTSPLPGLPDRYPGMSWSAARWRPFAQARSSPDRSCGFDRSPCDRLRFSIARA